MSRKSYFLIGLIVVCIAALLLFILWPNETRPRSYRIVDEPATDEIAYSYNIDSDDENFIEIHNDNTCVVNFTSKTALDKSDFDLANGYRDTIEAVTIKGNVKTIGKDAFKGFGAIQTVCIECDLDSIGENAFEACNELVTIYSEYKLGRICSKAFLNCNSLNVVLFQELQIIEEYAFANCHALWYIITEAITEIGDYAFLNCVSLYSVDLKNVETIGNGAFNACESLETIYINAEINSIGKEAFRDCNSLRLNTYSNAKYLGNIDEKYIALIECASDTSATCKIKANTQFIAENAFKDTNVTTIKYEGTKEDFEKIKPTTVGKEITVQCSDGNLQLS